MLENPWKALVFPPALTILSNPRPYSKQRKGDPGKGPKLRRTQQPGTPKCGIPIPQLRLRQSVNTGSTSSERRRERGIGDVEPRERAHTSRSRPLNYNGLPAALGTRNATTIHVAVANDAAAIMNGSPIHGPPSSIPLRSAPMRIGPPATTPTVDRIPRKALSTPTWWGSTMALRRLRTRAAKPWPMEKTTRPARVVLSDLRHVWEGRKEGHGAYQW